MRRELLTSAVCVLTGAAASLFVALAAKTVWACCPDECNPECGPIDPIIAQCVCKPDPTPDDHCFCANHGHPIGGEQLLAELNLVQVSGPGGGAAGGAAFRTGGVDIRFNLGPTLDGRPAGRLQIEEDRPSRTLVRQR
jgi:hypothetical protein